MKQRTAIGMSVAVAMSLGLMGADAAPASDNVFSHVLAAQNAAGTDFPGTLATLCIQPDDGSDDTLAASAAAAGKPRVIPSRESWYAEPTKIFDNLYWVGTKVHSSWAIKTSAGIILIDTLYNYAVEPEIIDGLKKLGLDPATVKYVIVSHGHADHDEGAKLLQDRYGTHVIMGAPDWDSIIKANKMPGGVPKRDMAASDGQKLTLGDETVTIYLTPGHTPGTLSMIFPVKDNSKTLVVAYSGGTGFQQCPPRSGALRDLQRIRQEIPSGGEGGGRLHSSIQSFDIRPGLDQGADGAQTRRAKSLCGRYGWRTALFHSHE